MQELPLAQTQQGKDIRLVWLIKKMGTTYNSSTSEKMGIFLGVVVVLALAELADRNGLPQKWHAAIIGSVCPFTVVILIHRQKWNLWKFSASLTACLVVHL